MNTRLGAELKRLRLEKGLTLQEVSDHVGVTLQYISFLENGKRKSASFEIINNIAKFYGVPLDYFARFIEDGDSTPLSEEELVLWKVINSKVQEEIYFKNGNTIKRWFRSIFQK